MHFDDIEFMWKDADSGGGGCPALLRVDGGYIVQGKILDDETRDRLPQRLADEDGVFVPANVLDRLRGMP